MSSFIQTAQEQGRGGVRGERVRAVWVTGGGAGQPYTDTNPRHVSTCRPAQGLRGRIAHLHITSFDDSQPSMYSRVKQLGTKSSSNPEVFVQVAF